MCNVFISNHAGLQSINKSLWLIHKTIMIINWYFIKIDTKLVFNKVRFLTKQERELMKRNTSIRRTNLNIYVGDGYYMTPIDKRIVVALIESNSPIGTIAKSARKTAELLEHDVNSKTGKVRISCNEKNSRGIMTVVTSTHIFSYKRQD